MEIDAFNPSDDRVNKSLNAMRVDKSCLILKTCSFAAKGLRFEVDHTFFCKGNVNRSTPWPQRSLHKINGLMEGKQ